MIFVACRSKCTLAQKFQLSARPIPIYSTGQESRDMILSKPESNKQDRIQDTYQFRQYSIQQLKRFKGKSLTDILDESPGQENAADQKEGMKIVKTSEEEQGVPKLEMKMSGRRDISKEAFNLKRAIAETLIRHEVLKVSYVNQYGKKYNSPAINAHRMGNLKTNFSVDFIRRLQSALITLFQVNVATISWNVMSESKKILFRHREFLKPKQIQILIKFIQHSYKLSGAQNIRLDAASLTNLHQRFRVLIEELHEKEKYPRLASQISDMSDNKEKPYKAKSSKQYDYDNTKSNQFDFYEESEEEEN